MKTLNNLPKKYDRLLGSIFTEARISDVCKTRQDGTQIIITNNPIVKERLSTKFEVEYFENIGYLEILQTARKRIHLGYCLKTHPFSESIKLHGTRYKSVVVKEMPEKLDLKSIHIIEDSIKVFKKCLDDQKYKEYTEKVNQIYKVMDYDLICSAIEFM